MYNTFNKCNRIYGIFVACVICFAGMGAADALAQDEPTIVRVRPSKILYDPGETGSVDVTIQNGGEAWSGTLVLDLRWSVDQQREIDRIDIELAPGERKVVTTEFALGEPYYGRGLHGTLLHDDKVVAKNAEFFQVKVPDDFMRQIIVSATISDLTSLENDPFILYRNFSNHFGYPLSPTTHLTPDVEPGLNEYRAGQTNYRVNVKEMIAQIKNYQKQGMLAGGYTVGATGGPAGYELARRKPQWFLRDERGAFFRPWQTEADPIELSRGYNKPISTWYALSPDFGHPEVVEFVANEVIEAAEMFNFDAFFFDSIYRFPDIHFNEPTWLWDGRPSAREMGHDELAAYCNARIQDVVREKYPNFGFWYNSGAPGRKNQLKAQTLSLKDENIAAFREVQGGQLGDPNYVGHYHRNFYEMLMDERNRLHKYLPDMRPPLFIGYITFQGYVKPMPPFEPFKEARYSWTVANQVGAAMMCAGAQPGVHQAWGMRPTLQFMTRYSDFLWAKDLLIYEDSWQDIQVHSNREVWWEEAVYRRERDNYKETVINIMNSPDTEHMEFLQKEDPTPARLVEVEYIATGDPKQVTAWAMQPYDYDSEHKQPVHIRLEPEIEDDLVRFELPDFHYYMMVVIREPK